MAAVLAACASAPRVQATSLTGTDFWLAWPATPDVRDEEPGYDVDSQLVVIAESAPVTVRVVGGGVDTSFTASPAFPGLVRLPRGSAMVTEEDAPVAKGIHLTSTACERFGVLLRVPASGASVADDVCRIPPVTMLGNKYLPVAYHGEAEFVVVATRDGTTVTITDTTCATSPLVRELARGEALLHRCPYARGDGDVTGTIVEATAPVAVVSGSAASAIIDHEGPTPETRAYWSAADVLLESPWPVSRLGTVMAHAPFRKGNPAAAGDLVRLVAACPETRVEIDESGQEPTSRDLVFEGDHVDLESWDVMAREFRLVRDAVRFSSTRPFQAASYTVGNLNAGIGDPSMSVLDPQEHWERQALVYLPAGDVHSLGIVCPSEATGSVRLDGAPVAGAWAAVGQGTGLSWMRLDDVPSGEHRLSCAEPMFVEASGVLPDNLYGAFSYPAIPISGAAAADLSIEGVPRCSVTCPGECLTLDVPGAFVSWEWRIDGVVAGIDPQLDTCLDATAEVTVRTTTFAGCEAFGRVTVEAGSTLTPPPIQGPSRCCEGACVTLAAPAGYSRYEWSTGQHSRFVEVCPTSTTTYSVRVAGDVGCGEDDHRVTTYPPPVPGSAQVSTIAPCTRGLSLTWEPATFRPGSPGGVYNVYRRSGDCAPHGDPSWQLLAAGLASPPYADRATEAGASYSYLVEAEDAPASGACMPGPAQGGPTAASCATPSPIADPGDPDAARLVSLSPHLRATGYERVAPGGPAATVSFAWPTAPDVDPATHQEAWRSDRADQLLPVDLSVDGRSWRDPDATGSWLYFYKVFNATDCGTLR
jgi:hypothetical protein